MNELKELRKQWIADLRKYPERQMRNSLGIKTNDKIQACCLGQLLITECNFNKRDIDSLFKASYDDPYFHIMRDGINDSSSTLSHSYSRLGLNSATGSLKHSAIIKNGKILVTHRQGYQDVHNTLASLNDVGDCTWSMIADFIEENPNLVFKNVSDHKYFKN